MIPNITNAVLLESTDENVTEETSKTFYLDKEKNAIYGYCDGIEAMKQTIYCILNTERFDYLIYSWNYGIELKHLIGENMTFVIPELERVITEALKQDSRVIDVGDFEYEKVNDNTISIKFRVSTSVGEIEAEKVVTV